MYSYDIYNQVYRNCYVLFFLFFSLSFFFLFQKKSHTFSVWHFLRIVLNQRTFFLKCKKKSRTIHTGDANVKKMEWRRKRGNEKCFQEKIEERRRGRKKGRMKERTERKILVYFCLKIFLFQDFSTLFLSFFQYLFSLSFILFSSSLRSFTR